jgi:hypothetical protein
LDLGLPLIVELLLSAAHLRLFPTRDARQPESRTVLLRAHRRRNRPRQLAADQRPASCGGTWSKVDRDIVGQAPWVPLANGRWTDFVSPRVGNYQYHPQWRALLDQMWVK